MKSNIKKDQLLIGIGSLLIALGFILNEWVLAAIFSSDGVIKSTSRTVIWSIQILSIFIGFLVIRYRNKIRFTSGVVVNLALLFFSLLIPLVGAEVVLRLAGQQPWSVNPNYMTVEPGGKFFTKHPTLGYAQLPGHFTVTLADGYSFEVNHLDDTHLRVTHPPDTYNSENQKDEIWIFGDSITYGWSLNDEETYPWLLQEKFPEYEIVNFGVSGYGTLHNFIQFQEALEKSNPPKFAIVNYASYHDRRNTLLRERKKLIAGPWNKLGILTQPYARFNKEGKLEYYIAETEYQEFPLMRHSALIHRLEVGYNSLEEQLYNSHEVSKAIITDFAKLAKESGTELIVAGIWSDQLTADMLEYSKSQGIMAVDISVDLDIPGNKNLPHDNHPSAKVQAQYSEMLASFLRLRIK